MKVMDLTSIAVEEASDKVYQSLERDVKQSCPSSSSFSSSLPSALSYDVPCAPSWSVNQEFSVSLDCLQLSPETRAVGVFRALGLQVGIFHGGKRLSPLPSMEFRSIPDQHGIINIQKVRTFIVKYLQFVLVL